MIQIASPQIGKEEREAVDRVLRSGIIAQGPEVAKFEKEFADLIIAQDFLNNCTSSTFLVDEVSKKPAKRYAPAPFTTIFTSLIFFFCNIQCVD